MVEGRGSRVPSRGSRVPRRGNHYNGTKKLNNLKCSNNGRFSFLVSLTFHISSNHDTVQISSISVSVKTKTNKKQITKKRCSGCCVVDSFLRVANDKIFLRAETIIHRIVTAGYLTCYHILSILLQHIYWNRAENGSGFNSAKEVLSFVINCRGR